MKNNKTKSTSSRNQQAKSSDPFFAKGKQGAFFAEQDNQTPFFKKSIQPKLQIGPPNDLYEQEADRIAQKVVQQNKQGAIDQPPLATNISRLPQRKTEEDIQGKTAFESPGPLEHEKTAYDGSAFDTIMGKAQGNALQLSSNTPVANTSHQSLEEDLVSSKGGGKTMAPETQNKMESAFGNDFSKVRVHDNARAVQMNRGLQSHAFAHGNDIYFNEGQYQPGTKSGDQLLAHELTHTIQQGGVQRKMVQRVVQTGGGSPTNPNEYAVNDNLKIDLTPSNRKLILPSIEIPEFKERNSGKFENAKVDGIGIKRPKNYRRGSTNQRGNWREDVRADVTSQYNAKFGSLSPPQIEGLPNNSNYYFKSKTNDDFFVFGTKEQVIETGLLPTWDSEGNPRFHEVDHIVEMQMGGQDVTGNYELLDARANGSSGPTIAGKINAGIRTGLAQIRAAHPDVTMANNIGTIKRHYDVYFKEVNYRGNITNENEYWSREGDDDNNIKAGKHWDKLEPASSADIERITGSPTEMRVFITGRSGTARPIPIPSNDSPTPPEQFTVASQDGEDWFPNYNLTEVTLGNNPQISGNAFRSRRGANNSRIPLKLNGGIIPLRLQALDGLQNTFIVPPDLSNAIPGGFHRKLSLEGLSPIQVNTSAMTEQGFYLEGKVLPTVPVIGDADIDIIVENGQVRIRKLFETGEFNLPGPFQLTGSSLELFMGTEGFGIEGQVDLEISHVGQGHITASITSEGGFALSGRFSFDTDLFDPAEVEVEYLEEVLTISGTLGIPEGKVRGIKSAEITVAYSEGTISASGGAELDIPGIQRGDLAVTYSEDEFSIGGDFQLSDDIPGIRGGSVGVTVSRDEEGIYSVHASGSAQPDIPGVESELSVDYLDGALTITGNVAYERGLLSGQVEVTATNRVIDEDGQPTDQIGRNFRVYGGGSLTLQITPWLAATAGVHFLPNGEIEVTGRIELPDTVDVFPRKSFDRNLFRMPTIEIPIFAIPLGPRSLGIVATINGGLDFNAGIGPGQIRDLFGEVTYNPDHPEQTRLAGGGRFVIPADAGLTLRADLGLGLSVGIASLTGGIEIAGTLGLEGEASAGVDVEWTPETGFELRAEGRVMINPKFDFDINLIARATLDLFLVSFSEEWRHNLYSFSWGPDIQFGLVFPIHYIEGQPFDISFDDLEVIYPELDIGDMALGLGRRIKNEVF